MKRGSRPASATNVCSQVLPPSTLRKIASRSVGLAGSALAAAAYRVVPRALITARPIAAGGFGSGLTDQVRPASRLTASANWPVAGSVPAIHQPPASANLEVGAASLSGGFVRNGSTRPEPGSTTVGMGSQRGTEGSTHSLKRKPPSGISAAVSTPVTSTGVQVNPASNEWENEPTPMSGTPTVISHGPSTNG